jgi:3-dehydroquinate synthase
MITATRVTDQTTLIVELGERSYPIVIGQGLLKDGFDLTPYLSGRDCLIVSNETVAPLYMDRVSALLRDHDAHALQLADGESFKSMAAMQSVIDKLADIGANRDVTVVALGGGVVGDIAGFAAACYMRGVACIQIPTTLLAQVDSSVGGKTGVNHEHGKNMIGAFHQPNLVLIDTDTLATLPDRELRAGLAEIIKYGAIADLQFLGWLEDNMPALLAREPQALRTAIYRSCELKAAIVSEDEREAGKRALLNFGHTFGHAIENCLGYGEWLHGEAVAAGMLMAAELSGISEAEQLRFRNLVKSAGLPLAPPLVGSRKLRQTMSLDKKVSAKTLNFVLLKTLGDAYLTSDFDESLLAGILRSADARQG